MALYTETVMDHFMHPRNVGEIADADGVGEVGNAKCGDIMKMYLKIKDNKIEDVKFETFGCGAHRLKLHRDGMIKGRTLEDALALTNQEVVDALGGLPAHKLHCSVLAEEAVKSAIQDYYEKNHMGTTTEIPKGRLQVLLPDGITKRTGRGVAARFINRVFYDASYVFHVNNGET
ncbi:MAG: iron-sulfur cluster assembly scaffold protein [Oscillospiraceae bacterium]